MSEEQKYPAVGEWFNKKFLEWQSDLGHRETVTAFAQYLGVGRVNIGQFMSGSRRPTGDTVHTIASKLGVEIYDVLGLARPDPELAAIRSVWDKLTSEQRAELVARAKRLAEKHNAKT